MTDPSSSYQQVFSERRFEEFDLHPTIQASLQTAGFEQLTPIQAQSLPIAIEGGDVAGQAKTGTGKTAAFLIAAFQYLLTQEKNDPEDNKNPRAIMIAPTRELAIQIHKDAKLLSGSTDLRFALAYGGIDYERQRNDLAAGCDILIGTPGRIIDYLKQGVYNLSQIQVVVLDEADRMFDLGFIKDIRFLFRRMPPPEKRLNLLFSATLSLRVQELAYEHMNDPTRVEIEQETMTADKVAQTVFLPSNSEKIPLLIGLLRTMDISRTMIFCNMKSTTERVSAYLNANGFEAAILSGDVRQKKRETLLRRFHDGELPILVATDVAARGLHIPDVSHVVNFDLPQDAEDYVHRVGRTARLGQSGEAVSFACEDYAFSLHEIEEYIGERIPVEDVESKLAEDVERPARTRSRSRSGPGGPRGRSGGRSGGRPGGGRSGGRRGGGGGPGRSDGAVDQASQASQAAPTESAGGPPSKEGSASADAPARKRRRRRRRRKPAEGESAS
ncbi:MAG: DEAD/DEAH box helicase [Pseudomonadota bacterium]